MFLFNPKTGHLKQASKLSEGFIEISSEQYTELRLLVPSNRVEALPDLDVNRLNAKFVKVSDGGDSSTDVKPDGVSTSGGFAGRKRNGGVTATFDAPSGNFDTIGNVNAGGGSFKTKPKIPDSKGMISEAAAMSDIAEFSKDAIRHITSPDGSAVINDTDKTNTTVQIRVGSKNLTGILCAGDTIDVTVGGVFNYNLPVGGEALRGGFRVIGGSTGLRIQRGSSDILEVDPANSPLDYLGTYDPKTQTPYLTDETGIHGGFYVCTDTATVHFTHGDEECDEGDWLLFEEVEGVPGGKWVAVPVGKYQSVHSVNGKIGTVVLTPTDLGLGNVKDVDQTNADNISSGKIRVGVETNQDITTSGSIKADTLIITNKLVFMG